METTARTNHASPGGLSGARPQVSPDGVAITTKIAERRVDATVLGVITKQPPRADATSVGAIGDFLGVELLILSDGSVLTIEGKAREIIATVKALTLSDGSVLTVDNQGVLIQ